MHSGNYILLQIFYCYNSLILSVHTPAAMWGEVGG